MSASPDAFPKMLEDAVETRLAREEQVSKKEARMKDQWEHRWCV